MQTASLYLIHGFAVSAEKASVLKVTHPPLIIAHNAAHEWTVKRMRLIDADAIIDGLQKEIEFAKLNKDRGLTAGFRISVRRLKNAPTIDAVPVVRCEDCKYRCTYKCPMYHTETCLDDLDGFDDYNVDRTDADGFCHLGARMDGDPDG